jgi:Flp pilus assembly protein TadG
MLLLVLGVVVLARLADAKAGVDGATAAAASAAARAPTEAQAQLAGTAAFRSALAGYALQGGSVTLSTNGLARSGSVAAIGLALVDLSFAPVPGLPRRVLVRSTAVAPVETWRTR